MQTKWGGGGAWYIHTWCISPMRDEASVQPLPAWLCSKLGLTKLAPPDDDGLRLRVRVRVRVRIRVRARARVRLGVGVGIGRTHRRLLDQLDREREAALLPSREPLAEDVAH